MKPTFAISRDDGRSNAQVVIDLAKTAEPGTTYTFADLAAALAAGSGQTFTRVKVRSVVVQAQRRLLKEHQRTLHSVRGEGYRLAYAREHMGLALVRRRRADVQLKKGLQVLRHVRWDEMDENTRVAHQGHLMVTEALYAQQAGIERRQLAVEAAIASLSQRVDRIEPTPAP